MLESAGAKRPFFFRKGTSDEAVLTQVFRHWHYRMDDWARHHEIKAVIEQRLADGQRPLIVDAGANIGASAVFFLLKIKSAKVIAIEPQAENFALLKRNLEGLNAECLEAAVGASAGQAVIEDPGQGHWGYRTKEAPVDGAVARAVPIVTIDDIYARMAPDLYPLIVKVDIEGAEKNLFGTATDWVARTPIIFLEPHDWMLPRQSTVRSFLRLMAEQDRDILVQAENIVAVSHMM
jgi:FkbM family methyltransferase